MEYFYNSSRAIRIPTNKIGAMGRFNEAKSKLVQEEGIELTANDMYGKLEGFTDNEIDSMLEIDNLNVLSYDKNISSSEGDNGAGSTMLDLMKSSTDPTDQMVINRDKEMTIESILSDLNPLQREVIKKYFGIGYNGNTMNMNEIADEVGMSRERIRMVKIRALKLLKKSRKSLELHEM